jgi:hypothetical protein
MQMAMLALKPSAQGGKMPKQQVQVNRDVLIQVLEVWDTRAGIDAANKAFEALRAALAEPVQEPVAWLRKNGFRFLGVAEPQDDSELPLYTAPPQRKPLTEEEIRDLWSWAMTAEAERTATTQQHAFARAIERALADELLWQARQLQMVLHDDK